MRYRPMLWLAACFLSGAAWSAYGGSLPVLLLLYGTGAFLLRGAPPAPHDANRLPFTGTPTWLARFGARRVLLLLGMVALFAGFLRHDQTEHARVQGALRLRHTLGQPQDILCAEMPEEAILDHAGRWQTTGWIDPDGRGAIRVRLTGTAPVPIRAGTVLRGRWRMRAVEPAAFPGGFDVERYLRTRGLSAQLDLAALEGVTQPASPDLSVHTPNRIVEGLRARMVRTTFRHLPQDTGAFLAAAIYGYRKELSPELRESFRAVGVGHLLAISGLHMGLVVGMAWWLVRWRVGDIRVASLVAIGVCVLYLSLCGGRIAAFRAAVIAVLYLAGMALGRRSDFLNSVGAAALLILFLNPNAMSDLGFQLSFTAVIFISRFHHEVWARHVSDDADAMDTPTRYRSPWSHRVAPLFLMSVGAWLGVAPLVAHAFHVITPIGLLVNPFAIPWMSLVLAGGMLLPLAGGLPTVVAPYAAGVFAFPARVLLSALAWLQHAPGAHVGVTPPPTGWVAAYYAGFLLYFIRDGFAGRMRWLAGGVGVLLVLVAGGWMLHTGMRPEAAHPGRVHLIPHGRGEVVVFELEGRRTVVVGEWGGWMQTRVRRYLEGRDLQMPELVYAFVNDTPAPSPAPSTAETVPAATDAPDASASDAAPMFHLIPRTAPPEDAPRWIRIEGTAYRMFLSRERDGRLVWWMFTDGARSFLLTDWAWERQLRYRIGRNMPGTGADVAIIRMRGNPDPLLAAGGWRHPFRMGRPREASHTGSESTARDSFPEPIDGETDDHAPDATEPDAGDASGSLSSKDDEPDHGSGAAPSGTTRAAWYWRESYGVLWLLPRRDGYTVRGYRHGIWEHATPSD